MPALRRWTGDVERYRANQTMIEIYNDRVSTSGWLEKNGMTMKHISRL